MSIIRGLGGALAAAFGLAACERPRAGLSITVRADEGVANPRLRVWKTAGQHLAAVAAGQEYATGTPGTYWVRSAGDGGAGELVQIDFTGRAIAVAAEVRAPVPGRPVTASLQPGASLALDATGEAGLRYRLLVPGDAFATATTLTFTPLTRPLVAGAVGGFELRTGALARRPLDLEVTGGTGELLATYDVAAGRWQPVSGTVDDDGVRFDQLAPAAQAIYSELGPSPAAGDRIARGVVPLDEAAYAQLAGELRKALEWASHRHPDGGPLDADEQEVIDPAADAMANLAASLAEHACADGPDVGALQVAATALRSARMLGGPAEVDERLVAMVERCVSQVRRQTDCRAAQASGDVVAMEIARQQLAQARRVLAAAGHDDLARDLAGELAVCTSRR